MALYIEGLENFNMWTKFGKILLSLFVVQLVCEYGDNKLESWSFFRYRYSFEVFNIILLTCFAFEPYELDVIRYDLVICLFYRLSNFVIICFHSEHLNNLANHSIFKLKSWYSGYTIIRVKDPELATLVMKQSTIKGLGLEKYISVPAWSPILSIESVDGDAWKLTRGNFDLLFRNCPKVDKFTEIANKHISQLMQSVKEGRCKIIDADAIIRLTLITFIDFLFGWDEWDPSYEIFVAASWEWRKEISVRGKADMKVKMKAIQTMVDMVKRSRLYSLFNEKWSEPECYSAIMQPFIISPAINVGDIMCAVKLEPSLPSMDAVLRVMHPFPIFERYVENDIVFNGEVAVRARTQVLMFVSDFRDSTNWPVFGAGTRGCPGMHIATPFLKALSLELMKPEVAEAFQPLKGHKYSGRHNDGWSNFEEAWYFFKTISIAFFNS